jgi:hypothetical protein
MEALLQSSLGLDVANWFNGERGRNYVRSYGYPPPLAGRKGGSRIRNSGGFKRAYNICSTTGITPLVEKV